MTQRETVLSMLRAAGRRGVTTADFLSRQIPRFSARINELRDAGHRIESVRVREGSYRYTIFDAPLRVEGGAATPPDSDPHGGPPAAVGALFEMPGPRPLNPLRDAEAA